MDIYRHQVNADEDYVAPTWLKRFDHYVIYALFTSFCYLPVSRATYANYPTYINVTNVTNVIETKVIERVVERIGETTPSAVCGNRVCEFGESYGNCPEDCLLPTATTTTIPIAPPVAPSPPSGLVIWTTSPLGIVTILTIMILAVIFTLYKKKLLKI